MRFNEFILSFSCGIITTAVILFCVAYPKLGHVRVKPIAPPEVIIPSSFAGLVSVENINSFKSEHNLKDDVDLKMIRVSDGEKKNNYNDGSNNSDDFLLVSNNMKEYRNVLDNLNPINVRAPSFSYMRNGEYYPYPNEETKNQIFEQKFDPTYGDLIFVRKNTFNITQDQHSYDHDDEVDSITILDSYDGTNTLFASIVPGVLVHMKPEYYNDYDEDEIVNVKHDHNHDHKHDHNYHTRKRNLQACNDYKIIDVAIAYDSSYCDALGGKAAADADVEAIIALASATYESEGICAQVQLAHLESNCDAASDDYRSLITNAPDSGCFGDPDGVIQQFRTFIDDNRDDIDRDAFHLFYNFETPDNCPRNGACGCANKQSMCRSLAHGVENMIFARTDATDRRAYIFMHELGHNVALEHVDLQEESTGTDDAPLWIMEPAIGFGVHKWKQESIDALQQVIPTLDCLESAGAATSEAPTPKDDASTPAPTPTPGTPTPAPVESPTSSPEESPTQTTITVNEEYVEVTLQLYGSNPALCLNVPRKLDPLGTEDQLKIWLCNDSDRQRFLIEMATGMVSSKISNMQKCLTIDENEEGNIWNGAPIIYKDCGSTDNDLKQRWKWRAGGDSSVLGSMQSQYKPNKCMQGKNTKGGFVRVNKCSRMSQEDSMIWQLIFP